MATRTAASAYVELTADYGAGSLSLTVSGTVVATTSTPLAAGTAYTAVCAFGGGGTSLTVSLNGAAVAGMAGVTVPGGSYNQLLFGQSAGTAGTVKFTRVTVAA